MRDFGTVRPGTTLYIPFATYDSNDPTASVTASGLATTDIEVYKDGGTTARASDSGYALLGTDGIDEYGTGVHGISINLADNTTAGFYAAGSQYWVVLASITVDAGTVNAILATFRIGLPDAVLNTTIATLSTQTSFTLTAGPAEDDALNGCVVYIHDVASAVQGGFAVIADYTGATKTVTLTAGTTFTVAASDNIAIYPPANLSWVGAAVVPAGSIPNAVAGASGGLFIAGSNAATSVTTALTANITGNLSGSVGSLATQAKADVNAEVVDALATDTYAESAGVPAATSSLAAGIVWLRTLARNKVTQTATTQTLRNDADGGNIATAAVSDDGTTFTRGEWT